MRDEKIKYNRYNIFFDDWDKIPIMQIDEKSARELLKKLIFILKDKKH